MFNFKESHMLFSSLWCAVSQGPSVPYQFLENRNEQSCTQFSGLWSWDRAHAWIPFSDLLPYCKLFSHVPTTQDVDCLLALWRLLFTWFCFCSTLFLLLKASLYESIYAQAVPNKAPLFHLRCGSPEFLSSSTPVPRSRSVKTITK